MELRYLFVLPMRPTQKVFGKKLGIARNVRLLGTQEDIAKAIGVKEGRVAAIEQAEVDGIDWQRSTAYAKAYRMELSAWVKEFGVPDNYPLPSRYLAHLTRDRGLDAASLQSKTGLDQKLIEKHISGRKEPSTDHRAKYAKAFGMSPDVFERGWQTHKPAPAIFDNNSDADESDEEDAPVVDPEIESVTRRASDLSDAELMKAAQDKKTPRKIRAHYMRLLADRIDEQV